MHSCSDKRGSWSDLVLLSIYVSTPASRRRKKITKKKKNKPTYSTTLLFGLRERGEEEGREGGRNVSFFKFLGFAGFWVRAVRDAETRERE